MAKKLVNENRPSGLVISSILLGVRAVLGQLMSMWFLATPMPMFSSYGMPSGGGSSVGFLGAYVLLFTVIGLVLAALELFTAYSLYHQKSWSRLAASVFAALMLIQFPFFTIFGLLILYFLWFDEPTKKLFPS